MSAHESAEQSVLGACMLAPDAYWRIADILGHTDFASAKHRAMFQAIADLAKLGEICDAVTMGEWFESHGLSELVPMKYALNIANTTPGATNIRAYAEIVAKHSQHRRVLDAGAKIAKVAVEDSLGEAHRILGAVARSELATIRPARDVMAEFVQDLQTKCDATSEITGLTTGFGHLDGMLAGLQPADLIIVAGRPSMGKTTFALNVAENVAVGTDKRVLVFTLEMSAPGVLARSVSSIGRVAFKDVRSPKRLEGDQWTRVLEAARQLKESGLLFDESCGITVEQICARARQCHGAAPLSLIVIDYLQFIKAPQAGTMSLAIQEITRELKSLAKALQIPIILISQLNRDLEKRADRRPIMADLRESGAIEQDADVILFLYRDGYYNADSPHKGFAELIVAKQRQGETGMLALLERLDQMRFEACDGLPEIRQIETTRPHRGLRGPSRQAAIGKDAAAGG